MVRESRKMTMREVQKELEGMKNDIQQSMQFLNVLFAEMDKCNMVLIRLLEKGGLLHQKTCAHCGFNVNTPMFDDIPIPEECPACQKSLDETKQTTLPEEKEEE